MKNLLKLMAVFTLFNTLGLVSMSATGHAANLRTAGQGTQASARWLQYSNKEYNQLYRNRNRTPEQQQRFEELTQQRKEQQESVRTGGIRNLRRNL